MHKPSMLHKVMYMKYKPYNVSYPVYLSSQVYENIVEIISLFSGPSQFHRATKLSQRSTDGLLGTGGLCCYCCCLLW